MEELAPIAAMLVFAYAFGTVFYHVFGRPKKHWLQTMAYPVVGIFVGEGIWSSYMVAGPALWGVHPVVALFSTIIAVYLDGVVETREVSLQWLRKMPTFNISINGKESDKEHAKVGPSTETDR